MAWETVPDDKVRHEWQCPECGACALVSPDWYDGTGTPVCTACDEDMGYLRTQMEVPDVGSANAGEISGDV